MWLALAKSRTQPLLLFPCWKSQADVSQLADAGNERRIVPATEPRDVAQGGGQHLGHLRPTVVAGCKVELSHSVSLDCRPFQFVEPNLLVFGENHPALLAHERQPNGVFRPRVKVASMALVFDSVLDESVENGLAVVKIFVEQNEVFRQRWPPSAAPTGSLLRSALT